MGEESRVDAEECMWRAVETGVRAVIWMTAALALALASFVVVVLGICAGGGAASMISYVVLTAGALVCWTRARVHETAFKHAVQSVRTS